MNDNNKTSARTFKLFMRIAKKVCAACEKKPSTVGCDKATICLSKKKAAAALGKMIDQIRYVSVTPRKNNPYIRAVFLFLFQKFWIICPASVSKSTTFCRNGTAAIVIKRRPAKLAWSGNTNSPMEVPIKASVMPRYKEYTAFFATHSGFINDSTTTAVTQLACWS